MSENVKTIAKVLKVTSNRGLMNYWEGLTSVTKGLSRIEKFCSKNIIFFAKNWDNYCENQISKQRVWISIALKMIITLMLINFTTCAIFITNPWIRSFFSNATHLMGNQRIVSTYGALGSALALLMGLFYYYEELNRKTFLNSIKNNQNSNRLSSRYSNRFALQLNLLGKFCINQSSNCPGHRTYLDIFLSTSLP